MPQPLLRREFLRRIPAAALAAPAAFGAGYRKTEVSIVKDQFYVNGKPTYAGRSWKGKKIEGLLLNSRMVQGVFDDRNSLTVDKWKYPDTGKWDANRNTREFVAAMPEWRAHGLLSFTVCMQGGSPEGYSKQQPWETGAYEADGTLIPEYLDRLRLILDKADELGMVPIVGCFYFGQDQRLENDRAVRKALTGTVEWILSREYKNVLLEVANECDVRSYDHAILRPELIPLLVKEAQGVKRRGRRLLVGTSFGGRAIPTEGVAAVSDFLLIHGNGVKDPAIITEMVRRTRALKSYRPMPILFNEDDHFDFDQPNNNFVAALSEYASWGYFDPGQSNYQDGYQCPPVNWGLSTERKRQFFQLLREITGA